MGTTTDGRLAEIVCECPRCKVRYNRRELPRRDGRCTEGKPLRVYCSQFGQWHDRFGLPDKYRSEH